MKNIRFHHFYLLIFAIIGYEFLQAQNSGGKVTDINFEKFGAKQEFTIKDWNNDNNIKVAWTNGFGQARAIIDDAVSHSGKQSLRILFPAEGVGPRQSGAQAPIQLPSSDEYYVSYWMRFSDNFKWGGSQFYGGKLPGLASGKSCSGCETCDGTNGFTARLMWGKHGQLVLYLYHMDKKNVCGDSHELLDIKREPFIAKRGDWINIIERVKINSGSNHDGEVQLWINGVEAIYKEGIRFVTNGDKVDLFYFSTFFGGSEPGYRPGEDCHIWFDDIKISTDKLDVF